MSDTIAEADALEAYRIAESAPDELKPQFADVLDRYRQQQDAAGQALFPSIERKQSEARFAVSRMFTDDLTHGLSPDKLDSLEKSAQLSGDPDAVKARAFNSNHLALHYGKSPGEIASSYESYASDYSRKAWGVDNLGESQLFGKLAGEYKLQDGIAGAAERTAITKAKSVPAAFAEWQLANQKDAAYDANKHDQYFQHFQQTHDAVRRQFEKIEPLVTSIVDNLTNDKNLSAEHFAEQVPIIDALAKMPVEQRREVYQYVVAVGQSKGLDQKSLGGKLTTAINQGMDNLVLGGARAIGTVGEKFYTGDTVRHDVAGELRTLASSAFNPANTTLEKASMGLAGVAPFLIASPMGWPAVAAIFGDISNQTYDRVKWDHPGISTGAAMGIASASAAAQTFLIGRASGWLTKNTPALSSVLNSIAKPGGSRASRFGLNFAGQSVEQGVALEAMALATPVSQQIFNALGADVPSVDWSHELKALKDAQPETLLMVLPLALIGAGVATNRQLGLSREFVQNIPALRALGYSEAQITKIRSGGSEAEMVAMMRGEWGKRPKNAPDMVKAAGELATEAGQVKAIQRQLEVEGGKELPRIAPAPDGRYVLTMPADESSVAFNTYEAAAAARRQYYEDQGRKSDSEFGSLLGLAEHFERKAEPGRKFKFNISDEMPTLADEIAKGTLSEHQARSRARIGVLDAETRADTPDERAALESLSQRVLGSSRTEFQDGIYTTTIDLHRASNPMTLIEEKAHGDADILIEQGHKAQLTKWIRDWEAATGDSILKSEDAQAVGEAYTAMVRAYALANLRRVKKAAGIDVTGLRASAAEAAAAAESGKAANLERAMAETGKTGVAAVVRIYRDYFAQALKRAAQMREKGAKLDQSFTRQLAKSMGIDEQVAHNQDVAKKANAQLHEKERGDASLAIAHPDYFAKLGEVFDRISRDPDKRREILQRVANAGKRETGKWADAIANPQKIDTAEIESRHGERRLALEADHRAAIEELQAQHTLEMGGARVDKLTKEQKATLAERQKRELANLRAAQKSEVRDLVDKQDAELQRAIDAQSSEKDKLDRAAMLGSLRTLDAMLMTLPPEMRAKVGGMTPLAALKTDAARLEFLKDRIQKIDTVVEEGLRKDYREELESLFKKATPTGSAGEKIRGKITVEGHRFFRMAEDASKKTDQEVEDRIIAIELRLAGEITPETIEALKEFGVRTEDEARDHLEQEQGMLIAFGDFKNREASEMAAAVKSAREVYTNGRLEWTAELVRRREARAGRRETLVTEAHGAPAIDPEIARKEREQAGLGGAIGGFLGEHFTLEQAVGDATGTDSATRAWVNKVTIPADLAAKDGLISRNHALSELWKSIFPGRTVQRLRAIEELQTRQDFEGLHLSQLEAVHYTMLWKQEGLRVALEATGYGEAIQTRLESWLRPEARAVRQWLWEQYDAQYDRLNEVFKRKFGVDLPKVRFYSPAFFEVHGKKAQIPMENGRMEGGLGSLTGFLRTRKNHRAKPEQVDAIEAWIRNAHQVEQWLAWAEPMTELRSLFGSIDGRGAIAAGAGKRVNESIAGHLDILEQAGPKNAEGQGFAAKFGRRMLRGVADVALVGKLVILAKQIPAAYASASEIGAWNYMRSAARVLSGRGAIGFFDLLQSDTIERRMAYLSPEWKQSAKGFRGEARALTQFVRGLTGGLADPRAVELALEYGRQRPGVVDAFFTTLSASAAYDHHYNEALSLGMGEAAARAQAHEMMEQVIMHTAQPNSALGKSLVENRMGTLGRSFFMFQSANRQALGMTLLAWKKGGYADFANRALVHWALTGLVTQTVTNLFRYLTSDDDFADDFTAKDYLRSVAMGPMTGIMFFGAALDAAAAAMFSDRYAPREASAASTMLDAASAWKRLLKHGENSTPRDYGEAATTAGQALGGNWNVLGVGWNLIKQILGFSDRITPGTQETVTKKRHGG